MNYLVLLLVLSAASSASKLPWYSQLLEAEQSVLSFRENPYHEFSKEIKDVAVIGAGPAGLQHVVELREAGLNVRLFERKKYPGGNWYYQEEVALPEPHPQPLASRAAFIPDLGPNPDSESLQRKLYEDGEDNLSLEDRLREHAVPSSVWANLHANSVSGITHFLTSPLPPNAPWELSQWSIRRLVRAYASNHELNSNDADINNITSYNTRVERVVKHSDKWYIRLRKLELLSRTRQIESTWWTETFDAVVIAAAPSNAPFVPNIPGLEHWASRHPAQVHHSRQYRRPERYSNQTVLIVGASISGSEIARDLYPHARRVITSVKDHSPTDKSIFKKLASHRIPKGVINLGEIASFSELKPGDSISGGTVQLKNSTVLAGIDSVILATGYVTSWPFISQFHNDTIHGTDDPDTEVTPIVNGDGKLRAIYLGTFYIPDPTLAVSAVRVWNVGPFSALAVAKVWSGKARLPNSRRMWEEHRGLIRAAGGPDSAQLVGIGFGAPITEFIFRKFVAWLNSEALILGGKQIDTYPREWREQWVNFAKVHWGPEFPISLEDFNEADDTGEAALGKRRFLDEVVAALENY